jgi:hypothetical protein
LTEIYDQLAAGFRDVRLALNRVADSLLHLDDVALPGVFASQQ